MILNKVNGHCSIASGLVMVKLKTVFCECWALIKIKIGMTCKLKEYEIKTKMVEEQWLQLKDDVFIGF